MIVIVPTPVMVTGAPTACVPAMPATVNPVMASGWPSTSVALFRRSPAAPFAIVSVVLAVTVLVSSPSTGALLMSRNKRSVVSGTAFEPDALRAGTPARLRVVAVRFSSLTSKPSLTFDPSKMSSRPSPSVSLVDVTDVAWPSPRSAMSAAPSLSESVSRQSARSAPSVLTGVRPMPPAAPSAPAS